MKRPLNYITKQSEAVLSYIASLNGDHVTAAQIFEYFDKNVSTIGLSTIYRHLEKLVKNGAVRKYNIDGISGACFQFVEKQDDCREHFHLKCEDCGELLHLRCDLLDKVGRHIKEKHSFNINAMKTVFYGKCGNCESEN